jgi:hypothetical protein
MSESYREAMGTMVVDAAKDIFQDCGALSDFCVQNVGPSSVVFGGVNRVIWTPLRGFRRNHVDCTERFATTFDSLYGKGW